MARLAESTRNRTVFDKAGVPFARSVQAGRPVTAEDQGGSRRLQHRLATLVLDGQALPVLLEALLRGQGLARLVGMQVAGALMHLAEGDRKSTRLNSSHVRISYAVFCLKK